MRTLNEQIQRLRDVLVTCYNAIKRKGGTIPEEGLRNMTNLPAAVLSIPQSHGVLTDLEVTANGEYLPEEGADGFSKVIAKFDTSSMPKVKVMEFKVSNNCINEYGRWEGEGLIDTSNCITFNRAFHNTTSIVSLNANEWDTSNVIYMTGVFNNCYGLRHLDVSNWNTRNAITMQSLFHDCTLLEFLDVSKWDVSKVIDMSHMFRSLESLDSLDLTKWDASKVTKIDYMFYDQNKKGALHSIIGNRTIEDVISSDIRCLNGLSVAQPQMFGNVINLDTASILALVNGLADLTGQTTQTLTLGSTIGARLDEEYITGVPAKEYLASIAEEKNWTIAY